MATDLETLRKEVEAYLEQSQVPVFYGYRPMLDAMDQVSWDVDEHPDFREFVKAAQKAGAKILVFSHRAFSLDQIDDALEQLEDSDLTREEKRGYETRLKQLQAYEGFTCSVELSFSLESSVYTFEMHTDWYEAMNQILEELDALTEEVEEIEGPDESSLGGYFSKN